MKPTIDPDELPLLSRVYAHANHYFDSRGRHCHRIPDTFTAEQRQRLTDAGLVPNSFIDWPHDEAVARFRDAAAAADLRRAADAFVASMVCSDTSWQAVLPALALGRAMPVHDEQAMGGGSCKICFYRADPIDRTQLVYFRHLGGSPWGDNHPTEGALALTQARADDPQDWPQPKPRDIWVFHRMLDLLRNLPPNTRYSKACVALKQTGWLRAHHASRYEVLLQALALIGILHVPGHPGLMSGFTSAISRDQRPSVRVEVSGPLAWWTAAGGIDDALVEALFGHLPFPETEPPAPAPVSRKPRRAAAPAVRFKTIPGPPASGSVYAVRLREDLWSAVYCHEVQTDERGVVRGRVEYLDLLSPTPPTAEQITSIGYRDRASGRWQAWCRALDKSVVVKRIAVDVPAPPHFEPMCDRLTFESGESLRGLAGWHFDF